MKYKILSVENIVRTNIGDYIQALASAQFLPHIDGFIDREKLKDYDGEPCKAIMNGWYIHDVQQWPPSQKINPLYVAFHINKSVAQKMLSPESICYLKNYEPIGCRDYYTRDLLQSHGVKAYFSGCMTLTLGMNYKSSKRNDNVFFVDPFVPYKVSFLSCVKDVCYFVSHLSLVCNIYKKFSITSNKITNMILVTHFVRLYSRLFTKETLAGAKYISQENTYYTSLDNEERMASAKELVEAYSRASFVVTSRIHCALPCTGLETPVYFVDREDDTEISSCRYGGLKALFHVISVSPDRIVANFDTRGRLSKDNIIKNEELWKPLAENLILRCKSFINNGI